MYLNLWRQKDLWYYFFGYENKNGTNEEKEKEKSEKKKMKNKTGKFSSVFIERALQCPLIFIASKSEWWLEKKPRKETERWGGVWKKWGGGGEEENKNLKKKSKCIISILYTRKEKALGPRRNEPNSRWNESRYVSGKELPVFSSGTSYKKIVSRRRRRRKKR